MKHQLQRIATWNSVFRISKFIWFLLALTMFVASRVEAAGPAAGDTIADGVLGQSDFVQHGANGIDGASFSGPINGPDDVFIDTQSTPHRLWLSDQSNHRVLGWENIDALTNGAPADVVVGQPDLVSNAVNAGGAPSATGLNRPHGLAVDSTHNLYVADTLNNRVLVFTDPFAIKAHTGQTGGFSAFMVFGQAGNFTSNRCNFGASTPNAESLCSPLGVKLDKSDNLWVTDNGNNRILAFFIPLLTDTVADLVIGQSGLSKNGRCSEASTPSARTLCGPGLLTLDEAGNLFVTDEGNSRALEYPFAPATGLADNAASRVFGQNGSFSADLRSSAETGLNSPYGISFDDSGNLFIADRLNNRVLEFSPPFDASPAPVAVFGQAGNFTSHACNNNSLANLASDRSLCGPAGVASDTNGNLWISDQNNSRLLRFTPPFGLNPRANLVLGQSNFVQNQPNSVDAINYNNQPIGIAVDRSSRPNRLYVADSKNNRVLGYSNAESFQNGAPATVVIGQSGFTGSSPNQGGSIAANGLDFPTALAVDGQGNVFVADAGNNRVLRFPRPTFTGQNPNLSANVVFGQKGNFGAGDAAELSFPLGVAVDKAGDVFISDSNGSRVLEYNAGFGSNPLPNKIFGQTNSSRGCNRDSPSFPTAATLCRPAGVALDNSGRLFVADTDNDRVLEFDAPLGTNTQSANKVFGQASFVTRGCTAAIGLIDARTLCRPLGVALDSNGRMYVADSVENRILGFSRPLTSPIADMVFGQGNQFITDRPNLDGSAPSAQTLSDPTALAVDGSNNLFTTDTDNNRVLQYLQPYAEPGVLSQSATAMPFGTIAVGTKSSAIDVTMTNTGIVPIFINRITIEGPEAADFIQTNNCVGSLKPASSCTIAGTFKPSVKAEESATMTVMDNAFKAPQRISMSGTGS